MNVDSSSSSCSTFRCLMGWRGNNCDQCVTSAGCMNGFCHLPYQCICRGGWRGELCDIGNQFFLSVFLFCFCKLCCIITCLPLNILIGYSFHVAYFWTFDHFTLPFCFTCFTLWYTLNICVTHGQHHLHTFNTISKF